MMKYALPVISLLLICFAALFVLKSRERWPESPPPLQPPSTPFTHTVAGAGVIEAQTENIAVGASLPGIVVEVHAKVGQLVRAGDPLFRIDDRAIKAELAAAEAALAAARAELDRQENLPRSEEVPVKAALVEEAKANLAMEAYELKRMEGLREQAAAAETELVRRRQTYRIAEARLAFAQAELDLLKAGTGKWQIGVARAEVVRAQAQVQRVSTDLESLTVRALVDGKVLQVNVRPGEFVASPSSQGLIVLGNTDRLHVRVDIDEYDIPRFRPRAPALAMVKGDSEHPLKLSYVRVEPFVIPKRSLTGDNTERVDTRVLQVIYSMDSPDQRVYVGQQLDVFISVE